jgi:hypothetical protein
MIHILTLAVWKAQLTFSRSSLIRGARLFGTHAVLTAKNTSIVDV